VTGTVEVSRLRRNEYFDNSYGVKTTGVKVRMDEVVEIGLSDLQPMIVQQISPGEIRSAVSWNIRYFSRASIEEVVGELNRNNLQPKIVFRDPWFRTAKISGAVTMGDPQAFADSLPDFLTGVLATATPDGKILLTHHSGDSH
jgi:ferric-dicitrate binding protein FerR (iron transport regulator)